MTDPLEHVTFSSNITLSKPVLVAAFRGWNDAGDSATFAASHLDRVWAAEEVATIDPEEFYDFQSARPQVELVDGVTRQITWPSNVFSAARLAGAPHDVLLLIGTEPNTKWRTFSSMVVSVAQRFEVELVITLGALLADVPHSRSVPITGTAVDPALIQRLGLARSRYEGPTGIVGVLHDALSDAGIDSASLWAAVPHYLAVSPNPKAALALVQKTVELIEAPADVGELVAASDEYDRRVTEVVAADEDVQAYVRSLEERSDEYLGEEQMDPSQLPSGDSIAAELERYLRDRGEGS
jgi:proteasome assembly chaperone (PAC2) family protein